MTVGNLRTGGFVLNAVTNSILKNQKLNTARIAVQRWRMKNSKMKNYKTQLVKIYGETRTLHEWSLMYEIPFYIIMKRYIEGWEGDTLLLPYRDRVVEYLDVHSLWRGKWIYGRRKTKTRSKKAKWVYVGTTVDNYTEVRFI